jgi:hypothetical protein
MAALPLSFGDGKAAVTPNGQTKEILGRQCRGYTVELTIPMTMAGETIVMRMSGPAWIATDGPGVAELRAVQKAFSDVGLSTSLLAGAQGPQGKGMAEATKVLSEAGVVMEQEYQMTLEGTGPMAQMMSQIGSVALTTKVTAISTDPIPDSKFALPEGYTKK